MRREESPGEFLNRPFLAFSGVPLDPERGFYVASIPGTPRRFESEEAAMDNVRFQEGILLTEQGLKKQFGLKVELNYLRCLAGSPVGRSKKIVVVPPEPRVGLCRFAR